MQIYLLKSFVAISYLATSAVAAHQLRRDLVDKYDECLVLKYNIQFLNEETGKEEYEKEACTCELNDGTIAELNDIDKKLCAKLISSESFLSSSSGFNFDVATQEVSIPIGATLESSTVENSWGIGSKNRRRMAVTTGDKTILVVRAKSPDSETSSDENKLREEMLGIGGTDVTNLASQYSACSYGQLTFSPNTLYGNQGILTTIITNNVEGVANSVIRNAMTSQAQIDLGISQLRDTADHVLLCIPPGTAGSWIGYAFINSWLSVFNDRWCEYPSILMHEIGHNLNLAHSGEGNNEYDDQSGMMGYSYSSDEGPVMCFNGPKSYQLGWFPNYQTDVADSAPFYWKGALIGTANRDQAATCNPGDYCDTIVFRLIPENGNEYYVAFNRKDGINSGVIEGANQVMITNRSRGTSFGPSLIFQKMNANSVYTIQNFGSEGDLTVTVDDIVLNQGSRSYAEVTIQFGEIDTPSPTAATPSPTAATPSPTAATPSPTAATPSPTAATPSPTAATPSPTAATPSPTAATPIPTAATPSPIASPTYEPIWTEGFEDGWGRFKALGRGNDASLMNDIQHTGNWSARIRDNTSSSRIRTKNQVRVLDYSDILISFWYYGAGMATGESFELAIRFNGAPAWTTVGDYKYEEDFTNGAWILATVNVPNPSSKKKMQIRFSNKADKNKGKIYLDDIALSGLPRQVVAPTNAPTAGPTTEAPIPMAPPVPQTPPTVSPVSPTPAPVSPTDDWVISNHRRCGASEADARLHCRTTCFSNTDCGTGKYCWGVHPNYCGSKPDPNPTCNYVRYGHRCGATEVLARETCGPTCRWAGDCNGNGICHGLQSNFCHCS